MIYFIAQIRKSKKMTQRDLERLSGVHRNVIYRIEKGLTDPCVSTLGKLASTLGVDIGDLVSCYDTPRILRKGRGKNKINGS